MLVPEGGQNPYSDKTFAQNYEEGKQESAADFAKAKEAHPVITTAGSIVGGIPGAVIAGPSLAGSLGLGAVTGIGSTASDDPTELAKGAAGGAAMGGIGYGIGKAITSEPVKKLGSFLSDKAEQLAVNATGATGKQLAKYAPETGRELLDQGIVSFGDTPADILNKTTAGMKTASDSIESSLKDLSDKGIKVSRESIENAIQQRMKDLMSDPSKAGIVSAMDKMRNNISAAYSGGDPSVLAAEQAKRGFGKAIKNWADPTASQANKEIYGVLKDQVENAVKSSDSGLSDVFTSAKQQFGLLSPVKTAAAARVNQLNQSPLGGFTDTAAAAAGLMTSNPLTAAGAIIGRRAIAPRLASSAAATLDTVGSGLTSMTGASEQAFQMLSPKLQQAITTAAEQGPRQLAITHFLLGTGNPEYQTAVKQDK